MHENTLTKSLWWTPDFISWLSVSSADLSLIPSHFCHCHCCLMESVCLKCLHGWLLIGPEVPNARRPFLGPNPRIIVVDRHAYLVSTPQWGSLCKACAILALSLSYCRCHTLFFFFARGTLAPSNIASVSWVVFKVLWSCNHCHHVLIASLRLGLLHLM